MTNEEMRIAIAEACGWADCHINDTSPIMYGTNKEGFCCEQVPNYPESLDMTNEEKQRLVNEWHRLGRERDKHAGALAGTFENGMARIEAKLSVEGVNPGEEKPEREAETPPVAKPIDPEPIDPEFAQTLSEQDRKNLEHFWGRKG